MKRYEPVHTPGLGCDMDERADGAWVRFEDAQAEIEKRDDLLMRAEEMLNPGREHRMAMDPKCDVCVWMGDVGALTIIVEAEGDTP